LAKRRSRIREAVKKAIWIHGHRFEICYIHREGDQARVKCVPGSLVLHADNWAVHLADGNSIPYHRIVEIRGPNGSPIWKRTSTGTP